MYTPTKSNWLATTFRLDGSVAGIILPRILAFTGFTLAICSLDYFDYPIYLQEIGDLTTNVVYNLVLGLLLVFRTNTAYDRFWDGRKAWGTLVVNSRNFARQVALLWPSPKATPSTDRDTLLNLLVAIALATKLHLRSEPIGDTLQDLITPEQAQILADAQHPPLQITFWIGMHLQQALQQGYIDSNQASNLDQALGKMIEGISSCERIRSTPLPIAYRIYLKRLILIYCVGLPFRWVPEIHGWAVPMVAVVSFILLGLEEVGRELDNPFGQDANDLPIDDICQTIADNVEQAKAISATIGISPLKSNEHSPLNDLSLTAP
ncbi:bestrophin family protein [Acaryochloris marina]|uniref:Bestrophin, RFP-TM, chloride channel n=1 Tax=Acaryochloris marina (strain MBIC 11017) TaxID=329726 RepID=B0C742_ACAM1|nr:bestrophin family ion channel [Acaryochloris marina]ABW30019.1 conserved hypothetical protein [Acaryochloris marina MBIC11017]BDM78877.1 hypothetical protein AM10699_17450 [Acaryochloris marina MBIC10699]